MASAFFQQGQEFQWQGRYDEAVARYQQVLRSEPNNAQAYEQMGICYIHMGWKDEAKACLEKAAQLDPKIAESIKQS
jgi:tetratricopeptide (TPR) repeat protein